MTADIWKFASCAHPTAPPPETWDAYLPGEHPKQRAKRISRAEEICHSCPIKGDCEAKALTLVAAGEVVVGVWGGAFFTKDGVIFEIRKQCAHCHKSLTTLPDDKDVHFCSDSCRVLYYRAAAAAAEPTPARIAA